MYNFCTYFDSNYISKGIALYLSLEKVCTSFHLYVMAYDKECYDKLSQIGFNHMTIELWDDWETEEIKAVKGDRNRAEYCWTCGPTIIYHILTHYNLPSITYLDSDLFFLDNPSLIFNEIGESSVAITEQGISPKAEVMYGKYCVQFMFFKNDTNGLSALKWWRDSCVEWCYMRFEDGKYADQMYLDQFPVKFEGVYVVKNPGAGIAPWNMYRYKYSNDGKFIIADRVNYPVVFFHMHGMKGIIKDKTLTLQSYDAIIDKKIENLFFNGYAELLATVFTNYMGKAIENVRVKGLGRWRKLELLIRSKLNKFEGLRTIYNYFTKRKVYSSGTKI